MNENEYTTNVGDFLIVSLKTDNEIRIAEVTQKKPLKVMLVILGVPKALLRLKDKSTTVPILESSNPFVHLNENDFVIRLKATVVYQKEVREAHEAFVAKENLH